MVPPNARFINPATLAKPPGFTHVIELTGPGRTIYLSGQVALDANGKIVGEGDFEAQATQVFENIGQALAAVGAGFEHVIKLNNYIVDIGANLRTYIAVRDRYVNTAQPPASTTVQVEKLAAPALLFEAEAVAVIPA